MKKNLYLTYKKPFSWEGHLNFYRVFSTPGLEVVNDNCFERIFANGLAHMRVSNYPKSSKLKVELTGTVKDLAFIRKRLMWMFDLEMDPTRLSKVFKKNRFLYGLLDKYPGLRLSRSWDSVEALVCTILSQLVSAKQARSLISELINNYGKTGIHPVSGEKIKLFPTVDVLSRSTLSKVRTTEKRRQTIREVAQCLKEGKSMEDFSWFLLVKGVGAWTVNYAKMRVGDTNAFPASDLAIARMIKKFKSLKNIDRVSPFRSYAAIYLWKHYRKVFPK